MNTPGIRRQFGGQPAARVRGRFQETTGVCQLAPIGNPIPLGFELQIFLPVADGIDGFVC
jgi:hypothetical protein